jgi:predicted secreted protein
MPRPELVYAGLARVSQIKEKYDTPQFRKHCKQIASSMAKQVQEYLQNHMKVLAILGVEGSASCGVGELLAY